MVDFDKLLDTALSGPSSRAFSEADADLNATVAAAARAVERRTGGAAELKLRPLRDGADGILYALSLLSGVSGEKQGPVIEAILVSAQGYPIGVGSYLDLGGTPVLTPGSRIDLKDKAALEQHFADLFSNPSSPLLQHIAFLTRKRS